MNIKKIAALVLAIITVTSLGACGNTNDDGGYNKITSDEALEMMEENEDEIVLDVRTQEEFDGGHIENAILIPDYEIEDTVEEILPDKDALILLYCRSGNRSATATKKLVELGYTNVYDFGGIIDWEYEVVTE